MPILSLGNLLLPSSMGVSLWGSSSSWEKTFTDFNLSASWELNWSYFSKAPSAIKVVKDVSQTKELPWWLATFFEFLHYLLSSFMPRSSFWKAFFRALIDDLFCTIVHIVILDRPWDILVPCSLDHCPNGTIQFVYIHLGSSRWSWWKIKSWIQQMTTLGNHMVDSIYRLYAIEVISMAVNSNGKYHCQMGVYWQILL